MGATELGTKPPRFVFAPVFRVRAGTRSWPFMLFPPVPIGLVAKAGVVRLVY